jgi:hypothetical protein
MGCGGAALAVLVLGGGMAVLWAVGYRGARREAEGAGDKPGFTIPLPAPNDVVPPLPAGNPFAPARGRLSAASCAKLKAGMTEAEVRALLGPPAAEIPFADVRSMGGMAAGLADQFPAKILTYQEGANDLQVSLNVHGRLVMVTGTVEGKPVFVMAPLKGPFENLPPGQPPPPPFERFPPHPFLPGGAPAPGAPR